MTMRRYDVAILEGGEITTGEILTADDVRVGDFRWIDVGHDNGGDHENQKFGMIEEVLSEEVLSEEVLSS